MLKEVLKDLSEMLDDDMKNVKSVFITFNDDGSTSFEVSEDDSETAMKEMKKDKTKPNDDDFTNAKYAALIEAGPGERMIRVACDVEKLVEGEKICVKKFPGITEMGMLGTINSLFKLIAESQNTKHVIQVHER